MCDESYNFYHASALETDGIIFDNSSYLQKVVFIYLLSTFELVQINFDSVHLISFKFKPKLKLPQNLSLGLVLIDVSYVLCVSLSLQPCEVFFAGLFSSYFFECRIGDLLDLFE